MRRLLLAAALLSCVAAAIPEAVAAPASPAPLTLAQFRALPAAEQAARIERAREPLSRWHQFEAGIRDTDRLLAESFRYENLRFRLDASRDGLAGAARDLAEATALDPTNVRAWLDLSRCQSALGDKGAAAASLDAAASALEVVTKRAERRDLDLQVARAGAWLCREQRRWGDGLAAAERGLATAPGDIELRIARGLLLADSGRFDEACAVAWALPAIEFPRYGWMETGLSRQRSDYPSRWIEAMAWLKRGDPTQAYAVLGEFHPDRPRFPFMAEYWHDVALICEQAGRSMPQFAGQIPPPDDPLFWTLFDIYALDTPTPALIVPAIR